MSGVRGTLWSLRAVAARVLAAILRDETSTGPERSMGGRRSKSIGGDGVRLVLAADPHDVATSVGAGEEGTSGPALAGWIERARRSRVGGRGAS